MTDMNTGHSLGADTCERCDGARRREGREFDIGKACDICVGRGFDYIGRTCRHLLGENP